MPIISKTYCAVLYRSVKQRSVRIITCAFFSMRHRSELLGRCCAGCHSGAAPDEATADEPCATTFTFSAAPEDPVPDEATMHEAGTATSFPFSAATPRLSNRTQ